VGAFFLQQELQRIVGIGTAVLHDCYSGAKSGRQCGQYTPQGIKPPK
jgi:hypothetical protein